MSCSCNSTNQAPSSTPPPLFSPTALTSVDGWRFTLMFFGLAGMNALRICNSSLIARNILGTCRSTSYFPSSPLSPLGAAKASINIVASERHAHYSRQQTLKHCRSSRILGRTAASILHTAEMSTKLTTQDHSSFANYLQAAVTHIDLGESSWICSDNQAVLLLTAHPACRPLRSFRQQDSWGHG